MQIFFYFVILAIVLLRIIGSELEPEIEMLISATILELKERINELLNVEVARQTLWYSYTRLKNNCSIESYGFGHCTWLALRVNPLMGQPKFNILVKFAGMVEHIRVRETQTVAELRNKISRHWSILVVNVALIGLSKKIKDHVPLSTYHIGHDLKVELKVHIEPC